jgi:hypothetical protein
MRVDLGESKSVSGVQLQAMGMLAYGQYVRTFKVKVTTTLSSPYVWVKGADNSEIFTSTCTSAGSAPTCTVLFSSPVNARYVQIEPRTYNNWPAMRAGILLTGDDRRL